MRTNSHAHRGNCLVQLLFALAVIGLLLLIVGVVGMFTSNASSALQNMQTQIQKLMDSSTVFEAPASIELELTEGGGIVALAPNGMVGDKRIGTPPVGVGYTVTIKDAEGKAIKYDPNSAPRSPGSPFEILGVFETKAKGRYTIEVKTSDGSETPAAIMVAAASKEEAEQLANAGVSILQGFGGACAAGCGFLLFVGFGIPALIVRARAKRSAQPDPLEHV